MKIGNNLIINFTSGITSNIIDLIDDSSLSAFSVQSNGNINAKSIKIESTLNNGLTNTIEVKNTIDGNVLEVANDGTTKFNKYSGTASRAMEVSTDGTASASKEFVSFIIDVREDDSLGRNLVDDEWVLNTFERDGVEGQRGWAGDYEYSCVSSFGLWTRYPINQSFVDLFITDYDVISSLIDDDNWNDSNEYIESDTTILEKIYNGQYHYNPFFGYKYFVVDIALKKILRDITWNNGIIRQYNISGDTQLNKGLPANFRITSAVVQNLTVNTISDFELGNTSGGSEYVSAVNITANELKDCDIVKGSLSTSLLQPLYISASNWNSSTIHIFIKIERFGDIL